MLLAYFTFAQDQSWLEPTLVSFPSLCISGQIISTLHIDREQPLARALAHGCEESSMGESSL